MFFIQKLMINNTIIFIVDNPQNQFKAMKNPFIITLLSLSLIGMVATAQTQKSTSTNKPSTTVKSSAPSTTTKTSTTTTMTIPNSTTAPVVVEEKKTITTTTTSPLPSNSMNSNSASSTTIIQQSSGPTKGDKNSANQKPEKVMMVKEPKPEKLKKSSSSSDGTGFHVGVKAGANNFFFLGNGKIYDGSFGATPQFSVGVHGGVVANYGISKTFALQLEALYVHQNIKFADGTDNLTITNNGIEIPLALQLNFGRDTKFFINAGGYMNYGLSGSYSGVQGGVAVPTVKADFTGATFSDRSDYGTILGVGVKFNQALFIEARANYSVKDGTYKDSAGKSVIPIFAGLSFGYFF